MSPDMMKILTLVDDLREAMKDADITRDESWQLIDVLNETIDYVP